MSDLNTSALLNDNDKFVIKDSDAPTFKYLTRAGFQSEVANAMALQQSVQLATAVPLTIASFDINELMIFLDFVSAANTFTINLPAPTVAGQRVYVSVNVLSGVPLVTIVIKDDTGATLYTINAQLTVGLVADQDLTWKLL